MKCVTVSVTLKSFKIIYTQYVVTKITYKCILHSLLSFASMTSCMIYIFCQQLICKTICKAIVCWKMNRKWIVNGVCNDKTAAKQRWHPTGLFEYMKTFYSSFSQQFDCEKWICIDFFLLWDVLLLCVTERKKAKEKS